MDNKTHPVGEVVQLTMDKLREMVDVNTVVGDPIHTPEGVTVIPVSKVSIGLVSGGSDFTTKNQPAGSNAYGGASSAGVNIQPQAFLVINGDNVRLLPVAPTEAGALDKAIDLLDEAAAAVHVAGERITVETQDVAQVVSMWTGVPVTGLDADESLRLLTLEKQLRERIIGQDEAVSAVARAIRRGRVGLKDPGRPVGSFLFLGPTGVGKTELCRALAATVYGDEGAIIRLDMSEYMEKHSVARLIGAPPGYVGYEQGGQLTEAVRRRPYSVVLFDEIEKAHPEVLNTLLQVMDDGVLTDSQGRKVDFKNTVIIMTSNIGARFITDGAIDKGGELSSSSREAVMSEVRAHFKPEFLNRIDDIIIFKALQLEEIVKIVKLQIDSLNKRLETQNLRVELTKKAYEFLAEKAYDPSYGARPLKRVINEKIENPLARDIISGSLKPGDVRKFTEKDLA